VEIARKRDTGRRLAELENSKCPDSTQGFTDAKRPESLYKGKEKRGTGRRLAELE